MAFTDKGEFPGSAPHYMTMEVHRLKTWPDYFQAILDGKKKFEVRKNDRDFKVGDRLLLREYNPLIKVGDGYTGRTLIVSITYILHGPLFGLEDGFCAISIDDPVKW